ncbi:MAG TPA: choice-of-anchor D domain-containing protein [Terriglobia bacterium]|nr:choice-of-anchor D domain-containing protein [Terriglobia bacterium]
MTPNSEFSRQSFYPSRLWLFIGMLATLVLCRQATGAGNDVSIDELMVGANGDSRTQFIVLASAAEEKLWGPQGGETQSRMMIVFFDRFGRETGEFRFPANPPSGRTGKTLIATREFASLPGAPRPDVLIPPLMPALSGKVCFRNNPLNSNGPETDECVSYGGAGGASAPALPIMNAVSLKRVAGAGLHSDFVLSTSPAPINTAGATFILSPASAVAQGEALFNLETFSGNGRTCSTCHVASENYGLPPENIQARYATLAGQAPSFDPLFIAETAPSPFDAGFDFNLNTLTLAAEVSAGAPCVGELRGLLTSSNGGRAKTLARTGSATYLVYGGLHPPLTGTVSDGVCSATVSGIAAGDLAPDSSGRRGGLEDPRYMRDRSDANFPNGRGLIMENIDGFGKAPVFRKSPHLVNVSLTAPYGLSGEFANLQDFTTGAVRQHFPRTLARNPDGLDPDFRLPTAEELAALEVFMLSLEFPAGDDPNKFDLGRYATTEAQRRGRDEFVVLGCAACHGGPALSQTTTPILNKPSGVNAAFDTGVAAGPLTRSLPCDPPVSDGGSCGSREFSTPQLFNLPGLGPFFHDGSARTLREAVDFYLSAAFGTSPANVEFIHSGIGVVPTEAITQFLLGLVKRPYTLSEGPVRFGARPSGSDRSSARTITIGNSGSSMLEFDSEACRLTGADRSDFVIADCPLRTALAPGETRSIHVSFSPSSNGLKSAIFEVHPMGSAPSGMELFGVGGSLGPAPEIQGLREDAGSTRGGDAISISGSHFLPGATILVGGAPAGFVETLSATTIVARVPAHAAGSVDVVVINSDGQTATLSNAYRYERR